MPIYSAAGDTRVLVVDLDASRGGAAAVRRDAAAIRDLVRAAGGRVITDESPSGGMHVYVPFARADRVPPGPGSRAGAGRADPDDGPLTEPEPHRRADPPTRIGPPLRRPPGPARHPDRRPPTGRPPATHPRCSTALTGLLAAELAAVTDPRTAADSTRSTAAAGHLPRRSGARELAADYLRIATTGIYDTARYRSPSEARQAVLDAAVWAGLTLPAVLARIENGTWPGLAAFYTRYRHPKTRRKALLADWRKALAYVTAQQAKKPTREPCP